MLRRILQMIKQAVITLVTSDTSAYPQGQAKYNGKTTEYNRLSPYGLDSNPPSGVSVILLSSQGQEAVKFGIASDFLGRKKGLKEGEVALYNTLTKSFVFLKENGDVEINTPNLIVEGNLEVTGDMTNDGTNVGKTHIHSQTNDGGGDSEADTGGPHS